MIIQIRSNNPHLLDVLNKNPNTDFGIYAKSLRNGQLIGNAVNTHQYDVVFQDTRYSYLPEESNQPLYQFFLVQWRTFFNGTLFQKLPNHTSYR